MPTDHIPQITSTQLEFHPTWSSLINSLTNTLLLTTPGFFTIYNILVNICIGFPFSFKPLYSFQFLNYTWLWQNGHLGTQKHACSQGRVLQGKDCVGVQEAPYHSKVFFLKQSPLGC